MLYHYMSRLCSFILLMCVHVTLSEIIEAHIRVINATCHDNLHHTNDCSTFTLKIGYYRCIADDKLIPGNRFEYDFGRKYQFNTSAKFIFTEGLDKTGFDYIMVVVMNNNFKGFTPVTTCESTKDKSRDENRNSTVIHTKSYFSESSSFSFDIEIKTVCQPSFCFGLRCEKCASNRMTTQDSSIEYITSYKTPSHSSRKVTSRHKTTTHSSRKVTSRHKTTTHSSRKVTSRHKTTTYSIPTGSAASLLSKTDQFILLLLCLWSVYYF
ncbi:uncharacterized protein [Mytilus edulis]|uniref:uncharacterized protein isoform X1 n=1 Tax=Mytilus edulis TaxID=6550 RepID=UPI0039EE3890